jgi:hypothetical protein
MSANRGLTGEDQADRRSGKCEGGDGHGLLLCHRAAALSEARPRRSPGTAFMGDEPGCRPGPADRSGCRAATRRRPHGSGSAQPGCSARCAGTSAVPGAAEILVGHVIRCRLQGENAAAGFHRGERRGHVHHSCSHRAWALALAANQSASAACALAVMGSPSASAVRGQSVALQREHFAMVLTAAAACERQPVALRALGPRQLDRLMDLLAPALVHAGGGQKQAGERCLGIDRQRARLLTAGGNEGGQGCK